MSSNDDQHLNLNKGLAMAGLALAVTAFELLPLVILRNGSSARFGRNSRLLLDHLLRAGGGVLIATTFLHLLPEVREGVEKLQDLKQIPNWPVQIPELVMCLGFFMMYFLEELVHKFLAHDHHDPNARYKESTEGSVHQHGELPHHHADDAEHHGGMSQKGHIQVDADRPLRGILLVIAVSIHQIFEGVAVGLEKDVKQMWTLLGAVAAHKLIIALCVGAEIISGGAKFVVQVICLFVFAIASPIGVGLGMILSSGSGMTTSVDFASTFLQGIATGTLMFVVFFEILSKSTERGFIRISQFFATFVGFAIMFILLLFISDD